MAFLGAAVAVLGYWLLVAVVATPVWYLMPDAWRALPWGVATGAAPLVGGALLVNWWFVRQGWASWRGLGWKVDGWGRGLDRLGRWTLVGMGFGALALGAALAGGGAVRITPDGVGAFVLGAAITMGVLSVAALGEELLFRGYPLVRLSRVAGPVGASVVLAVGFALLHVFNPAATGLGLTNVGLASLMLSAAFFTRGGMLAAWGVHLGWNAGLAVLADAPVSGVAFKLPGLEYRAGPTAWLTGGAFGPEGGVAGTAAAVLGIVVLVKVAQRDRRGRGS